MDTFHTTNATGNFTIKATPLLNRLKSLTNPPASSRPAQVYIATTAPSDRNQTISTNSDRRIPPATVLYAVALRE